MNDATEPEKKKGKLKIEIRLNDDAVLRPLWKATQDSMEVIAFALTKLQEADLSVQPEMPGAFLQLVIEGAPRDPQERELAFKSWLLSKGFQELVRGLHETLEEAYLYVEMLRFLKVHGSTVTKQQEVESAAAQIRIDGNGKSFPALLAAVNAGLTEPLHFEEEFQSLKNVRNCLEHRGGIVGAKDLKDAGGLKLTLPRLRVFAKSASGEVEAEAANKVRVAKGDIIAIRRGTREHVFRQGDRISFTSDDFQEICQACMHFARDLGGKLPQKV